MFSVEPNDTGYFLFPYIHEVKTIVDQGYS